MKQPPLITPREVDVPRAQRHTLPNGASLYAIPSDDFEVLRFTFVFRAGSSMQHAPFAASATANMLSEGSRDMTARQIADAGRQGMALSKELTAFAHPGPRSSRSCPRAKG